MVPQARWWFFHLYTLLEIVRRALKCKLRCIEVREMDILYCTVYNVLDRTLNTAQSVKHRALITESCT